jgi:DNA-binding response OmpR family regulator
LLPRELVARIRAILRRTKADATPKDGDEILSIGDLEIDTRTRIVRQAGKVIDLTAVEYALLLMLARAAGKIVTREELSKEVLGRNLSPFDRSIDTHVSNLRKKLGNQIRDIERIRTVRGIGYIYTPATPEKVSAKDA